MQQEYRIRLFADPQSIADKLPTVGKVISARPVQKPSGGKLDPTVQKYLAITGESHLRRTAAEKAKGYSLPKVASIRLLKLRKEQSVAAASVVSAVLAEGEAVA